MTLSRALPEQLEAFRNLQETRCGFWQSNIPVSCSQQQISNHHAEPQEHSSHRHNKRDLREI